MIAFLLCTGMRIGEASALTWQDIDYKNNVIHVTKTVSRTDKGEYMIGTPKSRTSVRDIPLNDAIKSVLNSQKEKQKRMHSNVVNMSQNVFENLFGGMVYNSSVNKAITETLKRLEEKGQYIDHFSAHALRDTFATRYIEQGGSPQVLKTILGHSSLAMTMDLYSHVLPNTKQKEMDNLKIVL
ncbi:MAG: site-specific integrase [Lachnospiraceae bacterium]|nr:site-specific integrase [Lachnospiraceae bacterium]